MKKIVFFLSFCLAGMLSYSQVTTDPKKQPQITTDNNKVKMPSLTPLCYGKVAADGKIQSGTKNFHIQKAGNGIYLLRCEGLSENSVVIVTAKTYEYQCGVNFADMLGNKHVTIQIHKLQSSDQSDSEFQFVVYNP